MAGASGSPSVNEDTHLCVAYLVTSLAIGQHFMPWTDGTSPAGHSDRRRADPAPERFKLHWVHGRLKKVTIWLHCLCAFARFAFSIQSQHRCAGRIWSRTALRFIVGTV